MELIGTRYDGARQAADQFASATTLFVALALASERPGADMSRCEPVRGQVARPATRLIAIGSSCSEPFS